MNNSMPSTEFKKIKSPQIRQSMELIMESKSISSSIPTSLNVHLGKF